MGRTTHNRQGARNQEYSIGAVLAVLLQAFYFLSCLLIHDPQRWLGASFVRAATLLTREMATSTRRRPRPRQQQQGEATTARKTTAKTACSRTLRLVLSLLSVLSPRTTTTTTAHASSTPFTSSSSGSLFRGVGDNSPLARTMKGAARSGVGEAGAPKKRGAITYLTVRQFVRVLVSRMTLMEQRAPLVALVGSMCVCLCVRYHPMY